MNSTIVNDTTGFFGLKVARSIQFECSCIVIETDDASPDDVIKLAREHGATYEEAEGTSFVVEFVLPRAEDNVGPEVYSESALRRSLTNHRQKPN